MTSNMERILLVLFVAVLLTFSRSNILSAQDGINDNANGNTDIIEDHEGNIDMDEELNKEDGMDKVEKIVKNKTSKKSKKYRNGKKRLTPEQKRQRLIERELKRFENAKKSISNREKKAKKILKKAQADREKELIKHDKRIEEIRNMEFDD